MRHTVSYGKVTEMYFNGTGSLFELHLKQKLCVSNIIYIYCIPETWGILGYMKSNSIGTHIFIAILFIVRRKLSYTPIIR